LWYKNNDNPRIFGIYKFRTITNEKDRNAISWEQKFEYDVWYVDNQSFWLDIKILWMTFLKVVKRSDISSDSCATMEKFEGSK